MITSTRPYSHPCHVCKSPTLEIVPGFGELHRIASDCKPWPPGGEVAICPTCGTSQAIIDATWYEAIHKIYSNYAPYYQGQGVEQTVFDPVSGAAISRSARLVKRLHSEAPLPGKGRLLDVGCGNGVMLRAFGGMFKDWTMAGLDVHDHLRPVVEGIKGVERLYTGQIEEVPGKFQMISLIHALEHIASPRDFLFRLREKLEPSGLLLIQVPDCEPNPIVLLVADHASHFFLPSLRRIVESAGYDIIVAANNWVAKELTIVARKKEGIIEPGPLSAPIKSDVALLQRNLGWLTSLIQQSRALSAKKPFGLFGSSIAGTWLFHGLGGAVDFFLDEDPSRPGNSYFNCPILAPSQMPAGAHVFIALPPVVAEDVKRRMEAFGLNGHFYSPEPIPPL